MMTRPDYISGRINHFSYRQPQRDFSSSNEESKDIYVHGITYVSSCFSSNCFFFAL